MAIVERTKLGGNRPDVTIRRRVAVNRLKRWLVSEYNSLLIVMPDKSIISIEAGDKQPMRTSGFGEFGHVISDGKRVSINRPHPLLPHLAPTFRKVEQFSAETLATFKPVKR